MFTDEAVQRERVTRAHKAMRAVCSDPLNDRWDESNVIDLLADLMHGYYESECRFAQTDDYGPDDIRDFVLRCVTIATDHFFEETTTYEG